MSAKNILIISAGIFPIPANLGGAVEELIDIFAEKNSTDGRYNISITSCDYQGEEIKEKADGVEYYYFKSSSFVSIIDKVYYAFVNNILKDWRSIFRQHYFGNKYYIHRITKKLELKKYDAIIVQNNMSLLKPLANSMGKEFDQKCIYHMHSDLIDNVEMIPYLARCRKILAVSNYVKTKLYETVPEFENTEIVKVTNGIKIDEYSNQDRETIRRNLRKEYGIAEDETVYLFSGRVSPEKGVLELVKAFANTCFRFEHKSRLMIVGSGISGSNDETYYYKLVKEVANKFPKKIIMTGYINHDLVTQYHLMSDVQIVPSIFDDPAPLTVLEGMSMGIFLLLSRVGGIPEYTVDYQNKIFFERDDNIEHNIEEALLSYDRQFAPHKYNKVIKIFDDSTFYCELAEAIDI